MGACSFCEIAEAKDVVTAYCQAVEKAEAYYGYREGYSGAINSTGYCGTVYLPNATEKYSEKNYKTAQKLAQEELDYLDKRDCKSIDLGIVGYDIITVKKEKSKTSPKLTFNIYTATKDRPVATKDNVKDAEAEALRLAEKNNCDYFVRKEYVNSTVTHIVVTRKRQASKPKGKNVKYETIHRYYFFGIAAE